MSSLDNINTILECSAMILSDDISKYSDERVCDKRLFFIKEIAKFINDKDDISELIEKISYHIDKFSDSRSDNISQKGLDEYGNVFEQNIDSHNSDSVFILVEKDRELACGLFEYVCYLLEKNSNVKLDSNTLAHLLNRGPKLFSLSIERDFIYRTYDYKRLINAINKNHKLEKLEIDDLYQLLIVTCQINNAIVFSGLVTAEQFKKNHKKIDEFLMKCNASTFVEVTDTIIKNFDKDYARFNIVKERNKDNFCEKLIIQMLRQPDIDYDFINQILLCSDISINYNFRMLDYVGDSDLKSLIAFRGNKLITNTLLKKEENIKDVYTHGERYIYLYMLYARVGDYDKAVAVFNKSFMSDLTDGDEDWADDEYTCVDFGYKDSISEFVEIICNSYQNKDINYMKLVELINSVMCNDNVKYLNLEKILPLVNEVLSADDYNLLINELLSRYHNSNLKFLTVYESEGFIYPLTIRVASDDEVKKQIYGANKILKLTN